MKVSIVYLDEGNLVAVPTVLPGLYAIQRGESVMEVEAPEDLLCTLLLQLSQELGGVVRSYTWDFTYHAGELS